MGSALFDCYLVDADTCTAEKLAGIPRAPLSYEMLLLETPDTLYLQNWVIPDLDYNIGRIEVYEAHDDASRRSTIRNLARRHPHPDAASDQRALKRGLL